LFTQDHDRYEIRPGGESLEQQSMQSEIGQMLYEPTWTIK
jgi:hypothetical protein